MAEENINKKIDKLYGYVTFGLRKDLREDFTTKDEFKKVTNEIFDILDKQTVILKRLDQERIFTLEFIKRVEKQVEQNTKDIKLLKARLKIS